MTIDLSTDLGIYALIVFGAIGAFCAYFWARNRDFTDQAFMVSMLAICGYFMFQGMRVMLPIAYPVSMKIGLTILLLGFIFILAGFRYQRMETVVIWHPAQFKPTPVAELGLFLAILSGMPIGS